MSTLKATIPGLLMIAVSLIVFSQALVMENQPILDPASGSFFPALIALIMLFTGGLTLIKERPKRRSFPLSNSEGSTENAAGEQNASAESTGFTKKDYKLILLYFCLVIGFVVILPIISFFPAAFLFLVASMFFLRGVSWILNLAVSSVTIIVIYFLFSELFNIVFP